MRDYTFINGARFSITNIFRSIRFDIDRLDINWVEGDKPDFVRGLRIVDHQEGNTLTVDGDDADNLVFSLTYIFNNEDNNDAFRNSVNIYLEKIVDTKEYLVTEQQKKSESIPEAVVH
jgi:hypothetical protein